VQRYNEESQELYSTHAGVRSGHSPIDCDCLIEGDSNLPVHVEATHYWVVGNRDDTGPVPDESEIEITEMRLVNNDVVVDARDIALLTGVDDDEVERTLINQVHDYIVRGIRK